MTRSRRIVFVSLAAALSLLILYAADVFLWGWIRAPRVVAQTLQQIDRPLRPADLSPGFLEILLAVEDPNFFGHHGVDLATPGAGITTITQGLVKWLFFERFKPGIAKFRQSILALALDHRVSKETQLILFLNHAYLGTWKGREVRGFPAAARAYFGKDFSQLTREEFIALVAMGPAPNQLNPVSRPSNSAERVRRIKRLLDGECRARNLRDIYYIDC